MSIRLVRKSSETPSISNRDDACSIRYAYGVDGYVPEYGHGMTYSSYGNTFLINGGRVNLQGWEIDIETHEIPISIESFSGTKYDFVYVELNLLLEAAEIKTVRSSDTVFPLSSGDDLSQIPGGIARLPLYRIPVTSAGIVDIGQIELLAYAIKRTGLRLDDIERRLDLLGFKEGTIEVPDSVLLPDMIIPKVVSKQGNYVIGRYIESFTGIPLFDDDLSPSSGRRVGIVGTIPEGFRPKTSKYFQDCYFHSFNMEGAFGLPAEVRIDPLGRICITDIENFVILPETPQILLFSISFNFGYDMST